MGTIASKSWLLCTASAAVVITSAVSSVRADQPGPPNIPAGDQESDVAVERAANASELPMPYEPWQGRSYRALPPPAPSDLPPPWARPRERARRPFEVALGPAMFLPSCAAGSVDDSGCLTLGPGAGLDAALLYRVHAFFAFGAETALTGFVRQGHGAFSGAGGSAAYVGVLGRVTFADSGSWDPWASLSLGYGSLRLRDALTPSAEGQGSGMGGRVAGGVDFLFGSRLRLGPTLGFSHFVSYSERQCRSGVCREQRLRYGHLLGFATLGLRVTASFGDPL